MFKTTKGKHMVLGLFFRDPRTPAGTLVPLYGREKAVRPPFFRSDMGKRQKDVPFCCCFSLGGINGRGSLNLLD